MFNTKVTELLGIKYPIMQGGLQHIGTPELASAVSNAGGLGTINATIYPTPEDLQEAIRKVKSLTDKPFCVNISMLPHVSVGEMTLDYFKVVIEEGVTVVETAGRSPEEYVPLLKSNGIKLIHKVPSARLAKKAAETGVDIVTIVGLECAGHPGMDEVTTMILGNKVSRLVDIPVLVGGGIVDGRGLVAALALGAEGIVMGTRFVATDECVIHPNFKKWIVDAQENDTMLIQRSIRNMMRAMKNETALKVMGMESSGCTLADLLPVISGKKGRKCQLEGNLNEGVFAIGQAIGLIDEIKPVQKVIDNIIDEAQLVVSRINRIASK